VPSLWVEPILVIYGLCSTTVDICISSYLEFGKSTGRPFNDGAASNLYRWKNPCSGPVTRFRKPNLTHYTLFLFFWPSWFIKYKNEKVFYFLWFLIYLGRSALLMIIFFYVFWNFIKKPTKIWRCASHHIFIYGLKDFHLNHLY
jgi:hypothetical protein